MYCIMENEELEMRNDEFLYALLCNAFILNNKRFLKKNKSALSTQHSTFNTDLSEVLR